MTLGNPANLTSSTLADETNSNRIRLALALTSHVSRALSRPMSSIDGVKLALQTRCALQMLAARRLAGTQIGSQLNLQPASPGSNLVEATVLNDALVMPPAAGMLQVQAVSDAAMVATCGNGQCEAGERPNPAVNVAGCPADCQFPSLSCPVGSVVNITCSGHGLYVSGRCECFTATGYFGEACEKCAEGFIQSSGGSCVRVAFVATCSDGLQNGDEAGVNCGGSCSRCSILDKLVEAAKEWIWVGVGIGACIVLCCLVMCCSCCCRSKDKYKMKAQPKRQGVIDTPIGLKDEESVVCDRLVGRGEDW